MKIKVNELKGAQLDYWVGRAHGLTHEKASDPYFYHEYSTDWSYGGPIIERERISIAPEMIMIAGMGRWAASLDGGYSIFMGMTPLIAAMRSYVASKFGEEVEVDDETK